MQPIVQRLTLLVAGTLLSSAELPRPAHKPATPPTGRTAARRPHRTHPASPLGKPSWKAAPLMRTR